MKANEAPEKIYLQQNTTTDCYEEWWPEWFETRVKDTDVEYTRTDAFIEKVYKFFAPYIQDNSGGYDRAYIYEKFKKYMEGE